MSTSNGWQEQQLRSYIAATWAIGKRCDGVSTIQLDGTRLGQPAKETIAYIMRSCRLDRAWMLPPQALGVVCGDSGGGGGVPCGGGGGGMRW